MKKTLNKAQLTLNKALLNEGLKKPLREKYYTPFEEFSQDEP
ncbi:hypothetical protein [Methanosarcina mazei]|nr:hypothetical protein [Methanosarcina mazei]